MQPNPWVNTSPVFDHERGVDVEKQLSVDEQVFLEPSDLFLPSRLRALAIRYREISVAAVLALLLVFVLAQVFFYDTRLGTLQPAGWLIVYVGGTIAAISVATVLLYRMLSR